MSDHLVNSWENVLLSSVDGDPIVALTWLHNGVKLALHVEMVRLSGHPVGVDLRVSSVTSAG